MGFRMENAKNIPAIVSRNMLWQALYYCDPGLKPKSDRWPGTELLRLSRLNCPFVVAMDRKGRLPKTRTTAYRLVRPNRPAPQRNAMAPMRCNIPKSRLPVHKATAHLSGSKAHGAITRKIQAG